MNEPPEKLDGAQVCFWSILNSGNERTDSLRLSRNGVQQQCFFGLAIAEYEENGKRVDGTYLFYCDNNWKAENDTYHDSIDEAMQFATKQYDGPKLEWNETHSNQAFQSTRSTPR